MDAIKILGSLLGNNATGSKRLESAAKGGAGDLLGSLLGGATSGRGGGGGLAGALGKLAQGQGGAGGLGGLLGGLLGGQAMPQAAPEPEPEPPTSEIQEQAGVLIIAMCNAAKVDGQIDQAEQEAILGRLGEVTQEEIDFVRKELSSPLDVNGFCRSVPAQLAQQVYGFSAMAIKLDTLKEAAYLGRLAQGLGLSGSVCNQIHEQVGAPAIFS